MLKKIVRKILSEFVYRIRYIFSSYGKKLFDRNESCTYTFGNEIFCSDKMTFEKIARKYADKTVTYWRDQSSYSLVDYFPERYSNQRKMLHSDFISLYEKPPVLMDIGCASGEWTAEMASDCECIDGFEYSDKMVHTAQDKYSCINNVHFYQGDARTLQFKKIYDGAMILGMLMYIEDENDFCGILKNVHDNVEQNGYICTKDTLNCENKEKVFLYNKKTGYNSVYWSQDKYYEMFEKCGFVLKKEILLDEVKTRRMHFIARGAIWQRK